MLLCGGVFLFALLVAEEFIVVVTQNFVCDKFRDTTFDLCERLLQNKSWFMLFWFKPRRRSSEDFITYWLC